MTKNSDDRRILASSREPGAVFDLYASDSAPEIFCDGASHAMVGPVVMRLLFHVVTDVPTESRPIEQRDLRLKLVMPTHAMIDFLVKTLQALVTNKDALTEGAEKQKNALVALLANIK
jgi:hypothetical protein